MKVVCITSDSWVNYLDKSASVGPKLGEICDVIRFIDKNSHDIAEDAYELSGYEGSFYMALYFEPIEYWKNFEHEINRAKEGVGKVAESVDYGVEGQ